ncbi:MAG: hypothetical protein K6E26_06255 [Clostridiales bacterium]|nr:hypothetical protein [Clostridiales bacterium]
MKKIIAVLLCMATVCTCVACGSSKETERTKKTKKTKDTTETEETDAPTDTTESDTSESSTETSAPDNKDFAVTHDLSAFAIKKTRDQMMFGAVDPKGDAEPPFSLKSVEVSYDILETSDTTSKVPGILEEYVHHTGEARTEQYQQVLDKFNDQLSTGSELLSYWFYEFCYIIRSDSQILSMQVETYGYSSEEDIGRNTYFTNYDSMSGTELQMDDVILDRGAFSNYVEEYFNAIGAADNFATTMADIHDKINDGSLTFGMTYDGILIDEIKLPVAGHGDIFNMKYFGSTPKNYTLEFDMKDELVWDFDGDGTLDELKLATTKSADGYHVENLKITYLGQDYTFKASELDEMDSMEGLDRYNASHMMCVDGKNYLLVSMDNAGEEFATYIFDINGSEPKFVEVFFSTPDETLDPTNFKIRLRTDIIGTVFMAYDFALGSDGHLQQLSSVGRCNTGPLFAKMPLSGKEYNVVTGAVGADTEVPSSAILEILGYDNKSGLLFVRVHPKYTYMEGMDIALETDKVSSVAGHPRDEAFIGINYAD